MFAKGGIGFFRIGGTRSEITQCLRLEVQLPAQTGKKFHLFRRT